VAEACERARNNGELGTPLKKSALFLAAVAAVAAPVRPVT